MDTTTWQSNILVPRAEDDETKSTSYAARPDIRLVELILAGDETAFEQIFERYKRLVGAVAVRYFKQPDEIDEIIQIAFTKAYFELKDFRGAHDFSLPSWLGRITTNTCIDTLRSRKRKAENLVCELTDAESENLFREAVDATAEKTVVERDLAEKLLAHLSAEDRAVLQMLDAEGLSVKEISALIGWSNAKVKVRAFRARSVLRRVLRKFL